MIFACLSKLSVNKQVVHKHKESVNLSIACLLFSLNVAETVGPNFVMTQEINHHLPLQYKNNDSNICLQVQGLQLQ